jgi:hypothetical protein
VTGGWRKPHSLYSSQNIIKIIKSRMRWAGHVTHMEEIRNAYKILVGNPEGKRPPGREKCILWKQDLGVLIGFI